MDSVLPFVSIIITNYNGKKYLGKILEECISSVLNIDYPNFEVIFVDNGSTDDSVEDIKLRYGMDQRLKFLLLKKNYGTAKAINEGIKVSSGDVIFYLNNDTFVPEETVKKMTQVLMLDDNIAIVGCLIASPNGSIQSQGVKFRKSFPVLSIFYQDLFYDRKVNHYDHSKKIRRVDFVWGTAIMIRKDVICEIGLVDENYYMYSEDLDWCYRAKKNGYEVLCVTNVKIIHYGSVTTRHFPVWLTDLIARNELLFIVKHFSPGTIFLALSINFLDIVRLTTLSLLKCDRYMLQRAKSRLKAFSYIKKDAMLPE